MESREKITQDPFEMEISKISRVNLDSMMLTM